MSPLNEDFTFDQLPAEKPKEVLANFIGEPQKTLFTPGMLFYRFITPRKGATPELAGNGILDAQWWFDLETRQQLSRMAHQKKTSLGAAGRQGLAVTQRFNREMEYLCALRLTASVYGWKGPASGQPDRESGQHLPGGSTQIYFPSLATHRDGMASAVAKIETWAYLDDARP